VNPIQKWWRDCVAELEERVQEAEERVQELEVERFRLKSWIWFAKQSR
jgi:hypothetical protein